MGDMCSGGSCTSVGATLQSVNFTGNYAHLVSLSLHLMHSERITPRDFPLEGISLPGYRHRLHAFRRIQHVHPCRLCL